MIVHVDDCYTVGDKTALSTLEQELNYKGLKLKMSTLATDYLSCDLKIDQKRKVAWIRQTTLMNKFINKYQPLIKDSLIKYKTPGTPKQLMEQPQQIDTPLSKEKKTFYRSGVGNLLQFSNKTRPDLANPVRELSKCMDQATPSAIKELMRVIKYVINTKSYGLKLQPKINAKASNDWQLVMYSDSDWASDKNSRKSVTGFSLFLQGAPILWKSQSQNTVALSSSEAE
jgi:hypothetical protein